MMRKYILIGFISIVAAACGGSGTDISRAPASNANSASEPLRSEKLQSTTVHTTENQPSSQTADSVSAADADAAKGGKWTASGNPIDTSELDRAIADAERNLKANANDADAKKALAEAYFNRGFALTEARQYAAALGDYRKALKLDPTHQESKKWEQQIIGIYGMMKKEYPKPGEEPAPLPFKK